MCRRTSPIQKRGKIGREYTYFILLHKDFDEKNAKRSIFFGQKSLSSLFSCQI